MPVHKYETGRKKLRFHTRNRPGGRQSVEDRWSRGCLQQEKEEHICARHPASGKPCPSGRHVAALASWMHAHRKPMSMHASGPECILGQTRPPENEIRSISALNMVRLKVRAVSVKARASTAIRWSGLSTRAPACVENTERSGLGKIRPRQTI